MPKLQIAKTILAYGKKLKDGQFHEFKKVLKPWKNY